MMKARVIGMVLAGALLAACSGGNPGEGAAGGAAAGDDGASSGGASSTITMRDDEFVPSEATVAAGDIELINEGESPHNFTVDGEGIDVDVDPGATVTQSIDLAAGTYTIFCEFHRSQGMRGSLTVES